MTLPALPPPGWYDDPWRVTQWRWWDGTTWTGYTDQADAYSYGAPALVGRARTDPADETLPIRAGGIAIAGIVAGIVGSFLAYVALVWFGAAENSPFTVLAVQAGLWSGLLGACVIAVRIHGSGSLRDLGLRLRTVDLALGLGYGIASLIGVGVIAAAIQAIGIEPHRATLLEPMRRSPLTITVVLLIAVVGAPFFEELFFRGLLMGGLVSRFGPALGIAAQALIFGLVHLSMTDATSNLGVFLVIAPVGAVLGVVRYHHRRLGTGMVTHAVYNAVIMTIALTHTIVR